MQSELNHLAKQSLDYGAIFRSLPGLKIIFLPDSPHFTIAAISSDFCDFVGQTEENLLGKSIFNAFPANPADTDFTGHSNLRASLEYVLEHKAPHRMERQRYDVDVEGGGYKQIYWSNISIPVLSEAGDVQYIIHMPEDITEKVLAEQRELKIKGIEKAYNIFMQAPMVIGINTGKNHVLELANEEAFKLWGKGPEIIGKPLLESLPELKNQGILELFDQVRETGEPFIGKEVPVVTYAGGQKKLFYYNLVYQPLYEEGNEEATGVFTLSHDVTELIEARAKVQESEERARLAVESADLGTYEVNLLTNELVASSRLAAIFDLEESANREQYISAIFPEDLARRKLAYKKAFETGLLDYRTRIVKQNGEVSWIAVKGRVFHDENKVPTRLLGVVQDITETKKFEDTLALRNKQLLRTNKDLDNFIYTASHDLRSPIANIEGLMLVLQEELTETNHPNTLTADVLLRIINSVDRLKNTISDLAEVTRLKHDGNEANGSDTVFIRDVYKEIMADLVLPANIKPCEVNLALAVEELNFSKKNFRSVFYNLLSNAIKYQSPERECLITVKTWQEEPYTVLSIQDNGLGISKQNKQKLFSMFKRFHDHVEGTGIGLYMVKRIMEDAGGKITVESVENEGTEFRVFFPQNQ